MDATFKNNDIMEKLNAIEKVQSILEIDDRISLPCIVVVGEQSSGKSSLLENFVGRRFLPTATTICTRCPVRIEMKNPRGKNIGYDAKCVFPGGKHEEYTFAEFQTRLKDDIHQYMLKLGNSSKQYSDVPLTIEIYSPDNIDLTLVDLPGIPTNYTTDLAKNLTKLSEKFCDDKTNIILAVTKAGDGDNFTAVNAMKTVNIEYKSRTIGVITHMDTYTGAQQLMRDENALKLLFDNTKDVLRWFGVKNSSDVSFTLREIREDENKFLTTHLPTIANEHGMKALIPFLRDVYIKHFIEHKNKLITDVSRKLELTKEELEKIPSDNKSAEKVSKEVLNFARKFKHFFSGKRSYIVGQQPVIKKLSELFSQFETDLTKVKIGAPENVTEEDIKRIIEESSGTEKPLMIDIYPSLAFNRLVNLQLSVMQKRVEKLLKEVSELLHKTIPLACAAANIGYENLNSAIIWEASQIIVSISKNMKTSIQEATSAGIKWETDIKNILKKELIDIWLEENRQVGLPHAVGTVALNAAASTVHPAAGPIIDAALNIMADTTQTLFEHTEGNRVLPEALFLEPEQSTAEFVVDWARKRLRTSADSKTTNDINTTKRLLSKYTEWFVRELIQTIKPLFITKLIDETINQFKTERGLLETVNKNHSLEILLSETPTMEKERSDLNRRLECLEKAQSILMGRLISSSHNLFGGNQALVPSSTRYNRYFG